MFSAENLHAGYGSLKVLNGVSISVDEGEIVGILGPNGAGKSTLLKTIFGVIDTWEGTTTFDGVTLTGKTPDEIVAHDMGFITQEQRVFPTLTVEENLEMGGFTVEEALIPERIESVYDVFPALSEKSNAQAKTLSGGQKRMLEIGMAFMLEPKLLLLDEPSLGLAPSIRADIFEVIEDLRSDRGISFLIVEQSVQELLEIADRGHLVEQGEITLSGSSSELHEETEIIEFYLGR